MTNRLWIYHNTCIISPHTVWKQGCCVAAKFPNIGFLSQCRVDVSQPDASVPAVLNHMSINIYPFMGIDSFHRSGFFRFSFQTESYFVGKQYDITDICTTLDLMILDFMHLACTFFSLYAVCLYVRITLCLRQGYGFMIFMTLWHPRRLKHCDPHTYLGFSFNAIFLSPGTLNPHLAWTCNLTSQLFYRNILIPRKQCNISGMCNLMDTFLL